MTTEILPALREQPELTPFEVIERVITSGDLSKMTPQERIAFYWRTCESLNLNPLTRPFEFISLNGKLTLYARKDCTDQLRSSRGVTVTSVRREKDAELGIYTVYAHGRTPDGREDESTGVVVTKGLAGEALANALMKAETKAKRRLTLSLVGLGFLDESEVEGAQAVEVDPQTGEVLTAEKPKTLLESVNRQRERMAAAQPAQEAPGRGPEAAALTDTTPTPSAAAAPVAATQAVQEPEADVVEGEFDELPGFEAAPRPRLTAEAFGRLSRQEAVKRGMAAPARNEWIVGKAHELYPGKASTEFAEEDWAALAVALEIPIGPAAQEA